MIQWVAEVNGSERLVYIETGPFMLTMTVVGDVVCGSRWVMTGQPPENIDLVEADASLLTDKPVRQIKLQQQGTMFFRRVWECLLDIPMGETATYGELATMLNTSPRAIASACRRNPFPGIIPCHRVVSASGVGGFMGQTEGQWVRLKKSLLAYETRFAND